jgi:hypothetical protein
MMLDFLHLFTKKIAPTYLPKYSNFVMHHPKVDFSSQDFHNLDKIAKMKITHAKFYLMNEISAQCSHAEKVVVNNG